MKADEQAAPGTFGAYETPDGFLRLEGRINGCGVYEYEDQDGNRWGELRLPEHVFAQSTLDGWKLCILTDDHPADFVTPDNAGRLAVGSLGSNVRPDSAREYTLADMTANVRSYIDKVRAGKRGLSCGYSCVPIEKPGVFNGVHYRYIQTSIIPNHVSGVDDPRGPGCGFVVDGIRSLTQADGTKHMKNANKTDRMIMIGTAEMEVPDAAAAEIEALRAKVEEQAAKLAELSVDEDLVIEPGESEVAPVAAAPMAAAPKDSKGNKGNTTTDARLAFLEASRTQDAAAFGQAVSARVELLDNARAILGASVKLAGHTDQAIQRAIVVKMAPTMKPQLDGKSAEYVAAAYAMAIEAHVANKDSSGRLMALTGHGQLGTFDASSAAFDLDAVYADSQKRWSGQV
jgi:hypothetical protein